MWTLAEARDRVTARVGEASPTFWSVEDRNHAINDAVRFIAAVTHGVPLTVTGSVDTNTPYLEITGNMVGTYGSAGEIVGGAALTVVPIDEADRKFPGWRTFTGRPRWIMLDTRTQRAYVSPVPQTPTTVRITVAVVPSELEDDSAELFFGNPSMEKYLGALVNYAVAILLLKERFDGEAERFYGFAVNELRDVGINPSRIPALPPPPGVVNDNG